MAAEGARNVVILAVHVGRDHAADGDEFGPRRHRGKETAGHKDLEDIGQQDARFAGQHTALWVEIEHVVEARRADRGRRVERAVAIGPAIAARDHRARRHRRPQFLQIARHMNPAVEHRVTPPAAQHHGVAVPQNTNCLSRRYLIV